MTLETKLKRNRILYSFFLVTVHTVGAWIASELLLREFLGSVIQYVRTPESVVSAALVTLAVITVHGGMLWLGVKRALVQTWPVILLCLYDAFVVFWPTIVVGVFIRPGWPFSSEWVILGAFLLLCALRIGGTIFYFQNRK